MTYHLIHLHANVYREFLSTTYCRVTQYFVYVLAFSSTLCLTMVCVDRYLAIIHPFFYVTNSMKRLGNVLMAWPWILSISTAIPALATNIIEIGTDFGFPCAAVSSWDSLRYFIAVIPLNVIIPFLCIAITCLVVFRVARKQLHRIQAQILVTRSSSPSLERFDEQTKHGQIFATSSGQATSHSPCPSVPRKMLYKSNNAKLALTHRLRLVFREETRIAFATIAVVIGFFIAWTPYLISRLLYAIGKQLSNDIYMFGTVFVLSNSAWNPLLILIFRKDIRKCVRCLCKRMIKFL